MPETTSKPRLRHFDMMKGVAIFLVVMGHVITMCVREVDRTPLFKFIENIHMPLFFFISGWFTYKAVDGRIVLPKLASRALQLLLPMVVVSSLWIFYFPHSGLESPLVSTFESLWSGPWKNGYWFTLVLFEIVLVYTAIAPLLSRVRNAAGSILISAAVWALLLFLQIDVIPADIAGYLSFELIAAFFPAFMLGVLGRRYRDGFLAAVNNSWVQTPAMLCMGVMMYICCWPWEFEVEGLSDTLWSSLLHICVAIIALPLFERWATAAFAPTARTVTSTIASIWEYVGTKSLGIYLLHYFFLFPMGNAFRPWLQSVNLSFVPVAVFAAFWAACIIATVLGTLKIISMSKPLNLLLTGTK